MPDMSAVGPEDPATADEAYSLQHAVSIVERQLEELDDDDECVASERGVIPRAWLNGASARRSLGDGWAVL